MWTLLIIVAFGYGSQQIGGFSSLQTCETAFESIKKSQIEQHLDRRVAVSGHYCVEVK